MRLEAVEGTGETLRGSGWYRVTAFGCESGLGLLPVEVVGCRVLGELSDEAVERDSRKD